MVMGYYQVPIDVLEDKESLKDWAEKALRVAERKANK
jgi:TfoX/Sxy family transcriptional regulator of competence genes